MNTIRTLATGTRRGLGSRSLQSAPRIALTLILGGVLSAAAPAALLAQGPSAPTEPPVRVLGRSKTKLEVQNDNWSDIHLYLVRDGMVTSLGFMTGPGNDEVTLPTFATTPGSTIQFLVLPVGGLESYLTPAVSIDPGDELELVVANNLPLSTVIVRPKG